MREVPMKEFQITEVAFDPADIAPTLEDQFTMESVSRELASMRDPEKLKKGKKKEWMRPPPRGTGRKWWRVGSKAASGV